MHLFQLRTQSDSPHMEILLSATLCLWCWTHFTHVGFVCFFLLFPSTCWFHSSLASAVCCNISKIPSFSIAGRWCRSDCPGFCPAVDQELSCQKNLLSGLLCILLCILFAYCLGFHCLNFYFPCGLFLDRLRSWPFHFNDGYYNVTRWFSNQNRQVQFRIL